VLALALDNPELGTPGAFRVRRLALRRFPYLLVYKETEDALRIVAVAHGKRKPGYWASRT
jgi:toxin ParE1/3/4